MDQEKIVEVAKEEAEANCKAAEEKEKEATEVAKAVGEARVEAGLF